MDLEIWKTGLGITDSPSIF